MTRTLMIIFAAFLLCPVGTASAAQVSASLDRDHVQLGETVTLTVSVEGASAASAPDFSVLSKDFDVLGTSSNQWIGMRNGKVSKTMRWGAALKPLRMGVIVIPALRVGSESTQALQLTVQAPTASVQGGGGDEVFVETSIEPASVYVGQQALIRVRLYYDGPLAQGNLGEPEVENAELRQLGDDLNYRATRDGRAYRVIERRYALSANKPGSLTVSAVRFQGQMQDARYGGFFAGGRVVHAQSAPREVSINPAPTHVGRGAWLPAHELKLELTGLPAAGNAQVGVPINIRLSLSATGLPFESLPKLSLPEIDGARVYPSAPITSTGNDGRWLKGQRQREFAIVPTQPGALTIPQISVPWWNTQSDTQEFARIPAHSLQVRASATLPGGAADAANGAGSDRAAAADAASQAADNIAQQPVPWRRVAIAALGLWLLTLVLWWWRRRRRRETSMPRPTETPRAATRKRAFMAATHAQDLAHTLLAWAQTERAELRNLGALATQLDSTEQSSAITQLERHCYATTAAKLDPSAIQRAFKPGFAWQSRPGNIDTSQRLPPLYR